jgi:class 3 adenylate cyclase
VIQRAGDRINPPFYGRYLASHIPGARYFEQPGDHVLRFAEGEELDSLFAQIEDFLASATTATDHARVLTTVLCAASLEHLVPADELDKWGGHLRKSGAGRVTATFDAPGQAIRCARAICAQGARPGLRAGAGIHTGEVYLVENEIHGTSVDIAASIAAHAKPGEVLVSRTVQDLVVGSGISFAERGNTRLNTIEGKWPLFTVIGA